MMAKYFSGVFVLALLAPSSVLADKVTCESENERQKECEMDTRGEVRIVKQVSKTKCVEGKNWGLFKHSVWVSDGCRAEFESSGQHSDGGHKSSGYVGGGDDAYRDLPTGVTCESENERRKECAMDTRGDVRVVKQLSKTKCVEGENWGLSKHSIWVDGGCRAKFELQGGGAHERSGPPSSAVRACNAVDDRYGKVVSSTPLKAGAWEIILDYDDGNYVCNVEDNGRVTYFEKLHRR